MSAIAAAVSLICASPTVHDGDSIRCGQERIRLANIDAPELEGSPRCENRRTGRNPSWCDYALGLRARDKLQAFLATGQVRVMPQGVDRYGRTLARVTVNGQDAGEYLIRRRLARRWQ
jgi:endonuclease YncB( thermonuclease family)